MFSRLGSLHGLKFICLSLAVGLVACNRSENSSPPPPAQNPQKQGTNQTAPSQTDPVPSKQQTTDKSGSGQPSKPSTDKIPPVKSPTIVVDNNHSTPPPPPPVARIVPPPQPPVVQTAPPPPAPPTIARTAPQLQGPTLSTATAAPPPVAAPNTGQPSGDLAQKPSTDPQTLFRTTSNEERKSGLPTVIAPPAAPRDASEPPPTLPPAAQVQAAPANTSSVEQVEAALAPESAYDTYGGQLLVSYLKGETPGDKVVVDTFAENQFVLSNMAEMSLAINQLERDGRYSAQDSEKVKVLEGALTQYLDSKAQQDEELAKIVKYGSAVALGVVAGANSDKLVNATKLTGDTLIGVPVRYAWRGTNYVYAKASSLVESVSSWLGRQGSRVRDRVANSSIRERSAAMYQRAIAGLTNRGGNLTTDELVARNIARSVSSPVLTKGYNVRALAEEEAEAASRLVFYRTGIPGFRINQREGESFLTARILDPTGTPVYYRIEGEGVEEATEHGVRLVVAPTTMISVLRNRLVNFGSGTLSFVTGTGQRIKTGLVSSRPYQFFATNPVAARRLRQTAVGGTAGVMTLLALNAINPKDLTIEDYVNDLQAQGINLEDFIGQERSYTQDGRVAADANSEGH